MKLVIELTAIWLASNIAFVLQRIYVANKREQSTRWHDQHRKHWGIS